MSIYGQLNKEFVTPNYTGETTSSVKTTVDNQKRTIKAEVIWSDMLGEDYGRAYPGHLGAQNAEKIAALTELLTDEIKRATSADEAVSHKVSVVESKVDTSVKETEAKLSDQSKYVNKITEDLTKKLVEEISRALTAEAELLTKLNSEIKDRSDFDNKLKAQVDAMSGNVTDIATMISEAVFEETTRAKRAEESLGIQIFNEQARAVKAESDIASRLTSTVDSFESQINIVSSSLADEVAARTNEIAELETRFAAEVDRSTSVDAKLSADIESLKTVDFETSAKLLSVENKDREQDEQLTALQVTDAELRTAIDKIVVDVQNQTAESLGIDKLIHEEKTRAESAEAELRQTLNATVDDVTDNAQSIYELKQTQQKHTTDITSLKATTQNLDVDAMNNDLSNIKDDVADISATLETEIQRATTADEQVASDIVAIGTTVDKVVKNTASLYTNMKEVEDSINDLRTTTSSKFDDVESELSAVDTLIDSEIETREAADADLELKISEVSNELNNYVRAIKNDGVTEVYAVTGEIPHSIIASEDVTSNGIVVRTKSGNIQLQKIITEDDFAKFDKNDAISKMYVDLLMADLQESIETRISSVADFDFIDGGNAPV